MKAIVLLSGGIDSATCLGFAVKKLGKENVSAVSVIYGQKHIKELQCAQKLADYYGIQRYEVDITPVMQFSNCPLLAKSTEKIRHESYADQIKKDGEGTVDTYVPFRNGMLFSTAGAIALSIYPQEKTILLYYGAHADDAAGRAYPDCTPRFASAMEDALYEGSGHILHLCAPLIDLNKTSVVAMGRALKVPYQLTWSCYEGGEKACGTCGTCIDRKAAFENNGMEDPIEYANTCD